MLSFSDARYPDNWTISILSSRGPGMVSNWLAVAMNSTFDKSYLTSR